jgi:hypothetical protein
MSKDKIKYYVIKQEAEPTNFVEFWAKRYDDRSERKCEQRYQKYIKRPLTPESVRKLFAWKAMRINRNSIESGKNTFVETVIASLDSFRRLPLNTPEDANNFLTNELKGKGMIWKIFTMHVMQPKKYPIFDQNVCRAMHYLQTGTIKEIPVKNIDKQTIYINEYLPFYNSHGYYEERKLDKALFSFGQFVKIPLERTRELQANRDGLKQMMGPSQTQPDKAL